MRAIFTLNDTHFLSRRPAGTGSPSLRESGRQKFVNLEVVWNTKANPFCCNRYSQCAKPLRMINENVVFSFPAWQTTVTVITLHSIALTQSEKSSFGHLARRQVGVMTWPVWTKCL